MSMYNNYVPLSFYKFYSVKYSRTYYNWINKRSVKLTQRYTEALNLSILDSNECIVTFNNRLKEYHTIFNDKSKINKNFIFLKSRFLISTSSVLVISVGLLYSYIGINWTFAQIEVTTGGNISSPI